MSDPSLSRSLKYMVRAPYWPNLLSDWLRFLPFALLIFAIPRIRIRIPGRFAFAAIICALAVIVGVQSGPCSNQKIIASQQSKISRGGEPSVNELLYALDKKGMLYGRITTSYLPLGQLPHLKTYYHQGGMAANSLKSLKVCLNKTSPSFLLLMSSDFSTEIDEWLADNGYKIVFDKVGQNQWRLVQAPTYVSSQQLSL